MTASMRRIFVALALATLSSCREKPPPIGHDPAALPSVSASTSAPAPSASTPINPQLECYAWLTEERSEPAPFPHAVHPGLAMGLVLDWAERRKIAKRPSVAFENVQCPRARCIEPEDCWYRIRLNDDASTAVSHLVLWLDVHAQTGDVRWEDLDPDGGWITRVEAPKRPLKH